MGMSMGKPTQLWGRCSGLDPLKPQPAFFEFEIPEE